MAIPPTGSDALDRLIDTVSVSPIGDDRFRGRGSTDDGVDATFGGHFLAQSISAALATVDADRRLHSIHASFLRAGRPDDPFTLEVERVRDGFSFATRRVRAFQDEGRVLFELVASCTRPEDGPEYQGTSPPAGFDRLPEPDSLTPYPELMRSLDPLPLPESWAMRDYGLDVRTINAPWAAGGISEHDGIRLWIRAGGVLPQDPHLQSAVLAYQSDESLADCIAIPWGGTWGSPGVLFVSLDHAMWFHRPFDLNDWHLLDQRPVTVGRARGLANASVWNREGQLVASTIQEALLRLDDEVAGSS